jgi:hypothetical protein
MRPKVLITLLTGTERQNWINPELSLQLFNLGRDPRFDVEVANVKDAHPVEVARNHTIKLARDHKFDWLVSFDNDNFMLQGSPLDIIAAAGARQSVIGLTYGTKAREAVFNIFPPPACGGQIEGPFQEVPAVAGGVLIIHRKVWETIPTGPWFRWHYGADETLKDNGCGEDIWFCHLVRKHGFAVWTHRELLAGHFRSVDLTGMIRMMMSRTHSEVT